MNAKQGKQCKAAQSQAKPTCGDGSSAGCSEAKQNKAKQSKAKVEQSRAEQSKATLSCGDGGSSCSGSKKWSDWSLNGKESKVNQSNAQFCKARQSKASNLS